MKKKYITLDYEEYLELLDRLSKIQDLISKLYNEVSTDKRKEIYEYMSKYCNWI